MIVHVSGIGDFQRCARKWYFGDRNIGLAYEPKIQPAPFALGTWVHETMYDHYVNGLDFLSAYRKATFNAFDGVPSWLLGKRDDLVLLGDAMVKGYAAWASKYSGDYNDNDLEFLAAEQSFLIPFGSDLITGTWDGIVRRRSDNTYWVFETKTTNNVDALMAGVDFDWQPKLYTWAAMKTLEVPVSGVIYNILRKQDPYAVKLLATGYPSTAKVELEKTTYGAYESLLHRAGGKKDWPIKNVAALESLKQVEQPFYIRMPLRTAGLNIERFEHQLTMLLQDMKRAATQPTAGDVLPSFNRYDCSKYCPFATACLAAEDGADYIGLLDATMNKKEKEIL